MPEPRPTIPEEREAKLHYAFNSLILVPHIFKFFTARRAYFWLIKLKRSGIQTQILGLYIERRYTFILVKLRRKVIFCGDEVPQTCEIWCRVPSPKDYNTLFSDV